MRRLAVAAVAVVAVAVAAAAATAVAGRLGGDDGGAPAVPQGRWVAARAWVDPPVQVFGDEVVAHAEIVVDAERLDPDRVRLKTTFAPFTSAGTTVERRDHARYTSLRYRILLRCLRVPCLTQRADVAGAVHLGRPDENVRFRPAQLLYDDPATGKPRFLKRVFWPRVETVSRFGVDDPRLTQRFATPFSATFAPLPALSYALPPAALAAFLLVAALALLVPPLRAVRAWAVARRPPPPVEEERVLTPLERALLLVEWTRDRVDGEDRRSALEVLAVELDATGRAELARRARALAWASASPTPAAADAVVASVKEEADGASA